MGDFPIKNGDFPIKKGDFPIAMLVYQRVTKPFVDGIQSLQGAEQLRQATAGWDAHGCALSLLDLALASNSHEHDHK